MSDETTPAEEETPVEETPVEETPAAEATDAPAAADVEDGEPAEVPTSKQLRKKARGTHTEAKPSRSIEERAKERAELRAKKAASRRRWRKRQKAKLLEARGDATPVKTAPAPSEPGNPKIRQGIVVSDKGEKTITVRVDVARRHPKYQKIVRSSSTLRVHDESNNANQGDTVRVIECRPMSRTKRWRLDEVVERAK